LRDETIKLREQTEKSVANVEKALKECKSRLTNAEKDNESIERALRIRTTTLMDETIRNRKDLEKLEESVNELKKSNETIDGACKRETEVLKKSVAEQASQLNNVQIVVKQIIV